ncbi:MAG: tetratricopeptide repeat protein [Chthonomonadales bacterium]
MSERPTGAVAFLFSDIAGSTRAFEHDHDAMLRSLEVHDRLMAQVMSANDGFVFKTMGDAFLVAFPDVDRALNAAISAQLALSEFNWAGAGGHAVQVRMAIHFGDSQLRNNDYFGVALARTDRILKIAHGGQILLSESFHSQLAGKLPENVALVDMKYHRLRDLNRPEHIYQATHANLPDEFPPLHSLDVIPNNLPEQLTSFVGRKGQIAEVAELVKTHRLTTLMGSGGCGKTRLALQVAADLMDDFQDGVWFVEMAPLTEEAPVIQAIARVFGVSELAGKDYLDTIMDQIKGKKCLLILDNCEHILEVAQRATDRLLRACPDLKILATSREPLSIGGEQQWRIPSLTFPNIDQTSCTVLDLDWAMNFEAVRLFIERAQLINPKVELGLEDLKAIAGICDKLDGIPLALELAAATVDYLAPTQILVRLQDFFKLLNRGSRTAMERHQTLLGAILWSYNLLDSAEQILLRRVSVFQNGWSLEAVEQVCVDDNLQEFDALPALGMLVKKSLVIRETGTSGQARYRLLESVRQFGRGKLREENELTDFLDRHRDFIVALVSEVEPHLRTVDQKKYLDLLEEEHDNIRAALAHSTIVEERAQIAANVFLLWMNRGYLSEGRKWFEGVISRSSPIPDTILSKALNGAGLICVQFGDLPTAVRLLTECHEVRLRLDDPSGATSILNNLGYVNWYSGRVEEALEFYEKALDSLRDLGEDSKAANTLVNMAAVYLELKRFEEGKRVLADAEKTVREKGDPATLSVLLHNSGIIAVELGEFDNAVRYFTECVTLQVDMKSMSDLMLTLNDIAELCLRLKRYEQSVQLLAFTNQLVENMKLSRPIASDEECSNYLAALHKEISVEDFDRYWAEGERMSLDEVVALVNS